MGSVYTGDNPQYGEIDGILTYYDPTSGQTKTIDVSDMSYRDKKPMHDSMGFYVNPEGQMVYGTQPAEMHRPVEWEGTWQMGPGPSYPDTYSDLTLGGGSRETNSAGQTQTGGWEGGNERDPWAGTYTPQQINWGPASGVNTVATNGPVSGNGPADLIGFENSTNKDFYQQQALNQRAQVLRNSMREEAARNSTPEPIEQGGSWDWTTLPTVQPGGGNTRPAGTEGDDWIMNPNYQWNPGETTNAQLLKLYGGLPAMSGMDIAAWEKSQGDNADWGKWNPNSGSANPFINGNPYIEKLFQNMWLRDAPAEPGVPSVPYGYASPVNAGSQ